MIYPQWNCPLSIPDNADRSNRAAGSGSGKRCDSALWSSLGVWAVCLGVLRRAWVSFMLQLYSPDVGVSRPDLVPVLMETGCSLLV